MAEVERTPQAPTAAGVLPTVISGMSSADTQLIPNKNGDVLLRVINGGAEATTVTIVTPGDVDGNAVADKDITVANGATKLIGPFSPDTYNDKKGRLQVKLSKVTSVTMEVTRVTR
jgi:hypothetical protein